MEILSKINIFCLRKLWIERALGCSKSWFYVMYPMSRQFDRGLCFVKRVNGTFSNHYLRKTSLFQMSALYNNLSFMKG
jgi:hypothetical protein